jgi:penicillin-binding protein 1A
MSSRPPAPIPRGNPPDPFPQGTPSEAPRRTYSTPAPATAPQASPDALAPQGNLSAPVEHGIRPTPSLLDIPDEPARTFRGDGSGRNQKVKDPTRRRWGPAGRDPSSWRNRFFLVFALAFFIFFGFGVYDAVYGHLQRDLPSVGRLENWTPKLTTRIYAADGKLLAEFASERREVVPLKEVPPVVVKALIATEDQWFYEHQGLNYVRLIEAAVYNLKTGRAAQGASTITQQLARNLFLTPEKKFTRKIKEAILAREIEATYSKNQILEMYLNQVYFGSGAYGIESAANLYFGKPARELNLPEAAMLVGLPKAPGRYSPRVDLRAAIERRNVVLERMRRERLINSETALAAQAAPIVLAETRQVDRPSSYFADFVRSRIEALFGTEAVWQEGLRVYTTLDPELQAHAEQVVEKRAHEIEAMAKFRAYKHPTRGGWMEERQARIAAGEEIVEREESDEFTNTPYLQMGLVALDLETGAIRAMVGGRSFEESKFNRITQARRQPGSTFKPFVYAAAMAAGIPASHVIYDTPFFMRESDGSYWSPDNFDGTFRGPLPLREALTRSINVVAVKLQQEIGTNTVIQYAHESGLTTPLPAVPSLAIGAGEVIPLEVASAYTVYPNLGVRVEPQAIRRIEDRHGNVLRDYEPKRRRVLDEKPAYLMLSILRDVVDKGTGRYGVRGKGFKVAAAGKTGTTNESTDSWFVGFTPRMLTLVWIGLDKKQKIMHNGTGGLLAAPTWTAFMEKVIEKEGDPGDFPQPEELGLKKVAVARSSGLLAAPFCSSPVYTEIFIPGTEPERYCSPMAWSDQPDYVEFDGIEGTLPGIQVDSTLTQTTVPPEPPRVDESYEF